MSLTEVVMPKLAATMERGRIVKWLKKDGDDVKKDEPLVEVETEKVTLVVDAPGTGVLRISVVDGDVSVMTVIGRIQVR